jgi:uncharacterized repeat protein (TIGR01451 family)
MVCSHASRGSALVVAAVLLMALQSLSAWPGGLLASPAPPPALRPVSADVAITSVTASPTPFVMVGSTSTYTFEFRNNGPDTADFATARLPTPTNTTFVSAAVLSGTGWELGMSPEVGGTGTVVWANGSGLESGATAQFQVVVQVDPSTPHYTAISATPYAYAPDDSVSTNNALTVTTRATVVADPYEPNDTAATATPIPMGTTADFIYSIAPDSSVVDIDWYRFCVAEGDAGKDVKVHVAVTSTYPSSPPSTWRSDIDFALHGPAPATTLLGITISASDNETLYLHDVASGCYYVHVIYGTVDYAEGYGWSRYAISIEAGTSFGVGYVTGRTMNSANPPEPIAGVQIAVYDVPYAGLTTSFVTGTSDADGYFAVPTLPGTHDLYFSGNYAVTAGEPNVNVVDEYYKDQTRLGNATHITVSAGSDTDVGTVTLDIGAIVEGTVSLGSGAAPGAVIVFAHDLTGAQRVYTWVDASGHYTLKGVPVGGAKMRFKKTSYAIEYYDDQPTFGTGTTLATVPGGTISPVNAVLTPGGTIGGSVTDVNGTGLSATVYLLSVLDSVYPRASVTSSVVYGGGYSFTNTKPGDYKIYVKPAGTGFAPEWFDNATSFASAATVTVTEGGVSWGNNIVLGTPGGVDFNGDLKADILWHHATNGQVWAWPMDGAVPQSQTYVGTVADTDWEVRAVADFTGDFVADLLWRNKTTGQVYLWTMNGTAPSAQTYIGAADVAYDIESYGDYGGDGKADLLWRNAATGELWEWVMNGAAAPTVQYVATIDPAYRIKGSGDLNGDGRCDIVWHHGTAGEVWVWLEQSSGAPIQAYVGTVPDLDYQIKQVADFDGNGKTDILWHNDATGEVWIWLMDGATLLSQNYVGTVADLNYEIVSAGDYNGDLKADILWWNSSDGEVWIWLMNGAARQSENFVGIVPDTGYQIVR